MTIDKQKLKAVAEALLRDEQGQELTKEEVKSFPMMAFEFEAMLAPSAVLALLAEIERLEREQKNDLVAYKAVIERQEELRIERDQVKAENEELRQSERHSDQIIETRNRLLKSILACPVHGDECVPHAQEWVEAARKDAERYRFVLSTWFPDLLPEEADSQIDATMAKEASHG